MASRLVACCTTNELTREITGDTTRGSYIEALVPRGRIVQRFDTDVCYIGTADALHRPQIGR
jgi:hypothetical protein